MIDLHCHVLPGLDDGAADLAAAIALAAAAAAEGVETLAATPHLRPDFPAVVPGELGDRVARLQDALREAAVDLRLVRGAEVDLLWADTAGDAELRDASYGGAGQWLLVETPYAPLTHGFVHMVHGLQVRGFKVLLAHPERNATFQQDPAQLAALVQRGIFLQVTAASLAGGRASPVRRLASALVRDGLAHVIASDRHGHGGRAGLREGVRAAARDDARRAEWMVSEAPAAILAGETPDAPATPPRRWFRR